MINGMVILVGAGPGNAGLLTLRGKEACKMALQEESGVEFCTVTDDKGTVLIRTYEPDVYGDSVLSRTVMG